MFMLMISLRDPNILLIEMPYSLFTTNPSHMFFTLYYNILDQRRVDIIDQVEYGVHDRLHIYPLCGIFYFLWHRH